MQMVKPTVDLIVTVVHSNPFFGLNIEKVLVVILSCYCFFCEENKFFLP